MASPGSTSERMVFCVKLQSELPGLDAPPWPSAPGQRIYEHISREAWEMWEERMKMILNEYKLLPFQKEAQALIVKQMEEFLFGGSSAAPPPGYVAPKA
jgi:Fe-S cluster biosynthesis and repair protein YggX